MRPDIVLTALIIIIWRLTALDPSTTLTYCKLFLCWHAWSNFLMTEVWLKASNENFTERNVFRRVFSLSDESPIKIKTRSTLYIRVYISFLVQYMVQHNCFWSKLLFFRFYEQWMTFDQLFHSNFLEDLSYHTPIPHCNCLWLEPELIFSLGDWYFRLISP